MIVHTYHITGMHCGGCVNTVKTTLEKIPGIRGVQVQLTEPQAIVSMEKDISRDTLQQALSQAGNYTLSPADMDIPAEKKEEKSALGKVLGFFHHKKSCCE